MSAPVRRKTGYLPTLDGWRAIAIALVFFNHASGPYLERFKLLTRLHKYGYYGVDIFFAISGLLICSRLLEEERLTGTISLRGFYVRRSFRIFPAAYLYLFLLAALALARMLPMDWPAWASALAFLRNYFTCLVRDTGVNRFTGHFWSLAIEEHFYLLLPSLLVFFPRRRKWLLFSLTIGCFLWLAIYLHITPPGQRSIYWDRRTDLRLASLLFPAWLALFLQESSPRERLTRYLRPVLMPLLLFLAITGVLTKRHFYPQPEPAPAPIVEVAETISAPRGGVVNPLDNFVMPLLFPCCVLSTLLHPRSLISRALEWTPLRAVGRISYSLYLWQQLFWVAPYRAWPIQHLQSPMLGLALSFLAAIASYFLVEKPLIRWGHRIAPPATAGHRDLAPVQDPAA